MSLIVYNMNGWPRTNATEVSRDKNWEQADAWMKQDKANRLVEGVGNNHEQVCWERVDKSKPFEWGYGNPGDKRWINFYPEARQQGGCLWSDRFGRAISAWFPDGLLHGL